MNAVRTALPFACILLSGATASASAQHRLSGASVFPEDFGTIQTVRELDDGRVLVADPLGKALYLVDMKTLTRSVVGSEGQGPDEYGQPDAVWPLPGDSTLLVDLGNGRLVALGPDLGFGRTMPIALSEPRPGSTLVLALPQGVDGQGRIYSRAMGGMGAGTLPDSAAILRIDPVTRSSDPVASFKLPDRTRSTSGEANNRQVAITNVPLSAEDAWGVAPDGALVLARAADYHVEWVASDGSVTRGPAVPFDRVRVGTAEKEEWVADQGRTGGGIQIGVEIMNGSASMSFQRGGSQAPRNDLDRYTWPDRKPPFYGGRIPVDGTGRAWVRRHVAAGAPTTYDLFDRRGARVGTVTLDPGRRVVGFGRSSVYAIAFDELDLNYLERYDLPATP